MGLKKVLIIGFLDPLTRPGGSFRTLPLAKHLPEFGWEPVVLTPHLSAGVDLPFRVIGTSYRDILGFWKRFFGFDLDKDIKRQIKEWFGVTSPQSLLDFVLTCGGAIINYPDCHKGWKPFALEAGKELLQRGDIDAVISCYPVTSHIVASILKAKYGVSWVADLTDLWSQNHNYYYGRARKLVDRRLERKTLSDADALVTVSEPWAEKLRTLHKGKAVYIITHGFDSEIANTDPAKLSEKFTITYTGTIYSEWQDLTKFLTALKNLISGGNIGAGDIDVRFYGVGGEWLGEEVRRYGLSSIIKLYGKVLKDVALEKQRESQLLLLLRWENPRERGWHSGKLFEYLQARRPILATGGKEDVVSGLLSETKAGICAETVEDIEKALKGFYQEYKLKGRIGYKGEETALSKYTHREMARKFSEILVHIGRGEND